MLVAPRCTMSFIHYTIVGHFDAATLNPSNIVPMRPLSKSSVESLLAESDPEIAKYIDYHDGYLQCCWTGGFSHAIGTFVHDFAYKLAARENCVGAELPFCLIEYPPEAVETQRRIFAENQL